MKHEDIDHTGLTGVGGVGVAGDPIWDTAGDLAVADGANSAVKLAAGTEGDVLTISSGVPAWEAPTGGGGGGSISGDDKPSQLTKPVSPHATDDEFDDSSGMSGDSNGLDAKWTKKNLGTAGWTVLDDDKSPGCVQFLIPTGQTTEQGIYQTIPAGDWTYECLFDFRSTGGGARQIWGLLCVDTSGNGVAMSIDYTQNSAAARLMVLSAWAQTATVDTQGLGVGTVESLPYRLFLRKASGVYFGAYSLNMREKAASLADMEQTLTPSAFTPAYIGFGRFYTGGDGAHVNLDYFRKVA